MAYAKILIKGQIELLTGLHIGGSESYSAIGAVDSPVVRDSISGNPIIPGSSIKGKMRSLLQKTFGASSGHDQDHEEVLRLFGSGNSRKGGIFPSRLKFSDCYMNLEKLEELKVANIRLTEIKTENTINRQTSEANPRQIERVVRGTIFDFELIYDVLEGHEDEVEDDFKNISIAFTLLEKDYLGGHGSRGSGRVKFNNLEAINAYGDAPKVLLEV
ncbi:MAG TPA: type III-A CRISPR-associated RAMP protein Csm3 [Clostridia bacterium]|nr:type III-A CRISPR-associated RAMP protein Csm3 [Clostridia bacterium]